MLRNFFFGNADVKRNEGEVPEIEDDQPRNKYTEIQILSGHTDLVDSLINIGNSRVLSTGQDKKGVLWDCASGEVLFELIGHTRVITSAFYLECYVDEDSNVLPVIATSSSDHTIRIWDLSNGQCKKIIKQHQGTVKCFCLVSNETHLIVSGGQDICLWNSSFQLLSKLLRNSLDYAHTVIVINSNRIVTATDQPHLTVYNILEEVSFPSPDKVHEIKEYKKLQHRRESITFVLCITDSMFASASMDGAIIIWSSNSLDIIRQFNNYENFLNLSDHTYPYKVNHLIMVDKRYLIVAIGSGFAIYDALFDKCVCRLVQGHHSPVTCIALLSNGSYLATSSLDGTVKLWAAPITQTYEDLSYLKDISSISRLFGKRTLDFRNFPLNLELIGMCCGHSNSVKSIIGCGMEGFISCGNDGLVIFWRDSELLQKIEDNHIRKVLANLDWLNH